MPRAFVFGDEINTDLLAPGHLMKLSPEALATHCLEALDPTFAASVRPGDVVVAGRAFGLGSSREQAAVSLKLLGVSAVLANSFGRIFYRNAINVGLPVVAFAQSAEIISGDDVTVDVEAGVFENLTRGRSYKIPAIPPNLMSMIRAGGLLPYTRARLAEPQGHSHP